MFINYFRLFFFHSKRELPEMNARLFFIFFYILIFINYKINTESDLKVMAALQLIIGVEYDILIRSNYHN